MFRRNIRFHCLGHRYPIAEVARPVAYKLIKEKAPAHVHIMGPIEPRSKSPGPYLVNLSE